MIINPLTAANTPNYGAPLTTGREPGVYRTNDGCAAPNYEVAVDAAPNYGAPLTTGREPGVYRTSDGGAAPNYEVAVDAAPNYGAPLTTGREPGVYQTSDGRAPHYGPPLTTHVADGGDVLCAVPMDPAETHGEPLAQPDNSTGDATYAQSSATSTTACSLVKPSGQDASAAYVDVAELPGAKRVSEDLIVEDTFRSQFSTQFSADGPPEFAAQASDISNV